jgi:lysophospholipase L1-like esterase
VNYQNIACWGDSQTFGARSYGCYPLYLAQALNADTRYRWRALNFSTNGHTARDLWFRLAHELPMVHDIYQACVLIGTNDVGNGTAPEVFAEYYRQILDALAIARFRVIYCGEIPPILADGHSFFARDTASSRERYNEIVSKAVADCPRAKLVRFPDMDGTHYCDPVHFTEAGNRYVAQCFAREVKEY